MAAGPQDTEELSRSRAISIGKGAAWYAAALIGVSIALWLSIETGFVKINQAITLGEIEGDDTYFSFDPSNTSTHDGYTFMETTLSFRTPQPNPVHPSKPYRSTKALVAYDCHRPAMGLVQTTGLYSEESAKGEVVAEADEVIPLDQVQFKPLAQGSTGAQLVRIVCSDISQPKIWWAIFKAKMLGGRVDIPGLHQ